MLHQGSLFDNRYELTRFIGRGGFAEVWLVTDRLTGLEEALKIYAPGGGMDEDGLRLFAKELSVVHDLRHTNLLTPKMLGQYENQPYLILPYCPNGSLNKFVGQCSEDDAWKILGQVAAGLAYLHQQGIVHQDIKPDNILLDANNDYVITDFGISLKAQSTLRKSMRIQANSGTMAYMAPERFSAEPHPIPANDVWSLGAMMFELIEGNVPFLAQMGGLAQMNGAQLPTLHANVGNNLKQTILSMLSADAEKRPTAAQLVDSARGKSAPSNNSTSAQNSYSRPNSFEQPFVDEKKTQIINTGAKANAYSRPNRFEQSSADKTDTQIIKEASFQNNITSKESAAISKNKAKTIIIIISTIVITIALGIRIFMKISDTSEVISHRTQVTNEPSYTHLKPIYTHNEPIWCDGRYDQAHAVYVSVPNLNRNHWRIKFAFYPMSYKGQLTWTDAQYPIILGYSQRSLGICLKSDRQIHITTENHKNLYDTGIPYLINQYNDFDFEYNRGVITINGQQWSLDVPSNDNDNVFTSICYSSANAFKGYIKNLEIYSLN